MKAKNIHNLDSLEREIYRLSLETKKSGQRLAENITQLPKNFSTLLTNSFCFKRKNNGATNGFYGSAVNKVSDHLAERVVEGIDKLIRKLFR